MQQYRFRYEMDPSMIEIRPNTTVSAWEDWEEMLARGTLVAYHGLARADVSSEVRKLVQAKMKNSTEFGAALRWSIQARGSGDMYAVLQGLPRPAGSLRQDGRFTTAYCAGIDLAVIKLVVKTKKEAPCRGPVPILFSRDVDKTKTELKEKPSNMTGGKPYTVKCTQIKYTQTTRKLTPWAEQNEDDLNLCFASRLATGAEPDSLCTGDRPGGGARAGEARHCGHRLLPPAAHREEEVVGRAGRRAGRVRETGAVEKETENRR
jgi:hypothetical protein